MKNIWFVILALALVGAGAWYFNKYYLNKTASETAQNVSKPVETETNEMKLTTEKLIFAATQASAKTINSIDVQGNMSMLFTDSDEAQKIKKIGYLALSAREAPLIVGENSLVAVKLDGSGKSEALGNQTTASFSPDAKRISFINFSNAERNFGYSLFVEDINGENSKKLATSPVQMRNPVWGEADQLYYLQESEDKTAIMKVSTSVDEPQKIYDTTENIYSLGFSGGKIVFSQGPSGAKQSVIFIMTDSGESQKILLEDGIIYDPVISGDGLNVAYLKSAAAGDEPSGDIFLASLDGKNKKTLTKGIKILGWLP